MSGPYGLITFTATVDGGRVSFASVAAPHAGTAIGACIEQAMREMRAPKTLGFTRVKRSTINAPGKG